MGLFIKGLQRRTITFKYFKGEDIYVKRGLVGGRPIEQVQETGNPRVYRPVLSLTGRRHLPTVVP